MNGQVRSFDVIVVGLGAMGSAAACTLARRGARVLGLERFQPGHTQGSSHGESRIIRLAYFEHPDYVPLLRRAYTLWDQLAIEAKVRVRVQTGGVFLGPAAGDLVAGSLRSAIEHGIKHEVLDADEIRRRHPGLNPDDATAALFEPTAGVVLPERAISAFQEVARLHGAELRWDERVMQWSADGSGVRVETARGSYHADRLVLTAGAWLGPLMAEVGLPLQPERMPIFWFTPAANPEHFLPERLPVWIWQTPNLGFFYGFPHLAWPGVKIGRHHSEEPCDPDQMSRDATPRDEQRVRQLIRRSMPDLDGPLARSSVCIYTNTPDEHFLVDQHPIHPNVAFAGGFSGHGFKFAPVIGEVLADLATGVEPTPHAAFLRLSRLTGARAVEPVRRG
ncbi:MAG: N-methyl-L-tryptophan oxidase [Chloroflexi bacterium]|nr:N-methyl-L-tryptophan oxidase [Chloroflexota bacterium]